MTDDIVAFIQARLDEDEREANAAFSNQADPENGWGEHGRAVTPHVGVIHEDIQRAHVVKWNPARVLRGVEAKRRILEEHPHVKTRPLPGNEYPDFGCKMCSRGYDGPQGFGWCATVRALASEWSTHPHFRPEWSAR